MFMELLTMGILVVVLAMATRREQHHKELMQALNQNSRQLSAVHAAVYNLTGPKSSATTDQAGQAQ